MLTRLMLKVFGINGRLQMLTHEEQWSKQKADNDEEMGILSFPTTCHR